MIHKSCTVYVSEEKWEQCGPIFQSIFAMFSAKGQLTTALIVRPEEEQIDNFLNPKINSIPSFFNSHNHILLNRSD